ncbi:unnamed protein product, partial [Bemisia tabaci]
CWRSADAVWCKTFCLTFVSSTLRGYTYPATMTNHLRRWTPSVESTVGAPSRSCCSNIFSWCFILQPCRNTTEQLTASSITCLFFAHSIVKFIYFSVKGKSVCRVLDSWNQENSHPLFVESNKRHKVRALYRMRKLLYMIIGGSFFTYFAWILLTIAEEPYRMMPDPENRNNTVLTRVPKLLIQTWFPWNYESGVGYYVALGYQLYWLFMMIAHENLPDTLFCSTVIYACEQLKHLKENP